SRMDAISITVDFSLRAAKSTPLPEIKSVLAGTIQATNGSEYNTSRAGAKPHGQKDKALLPKKLIWRYPRPIRNRPCRRGSGAAPRRPPVIEM
ncbi:MAG: hypothetical protein IJH67_04795, partial [Thermoguttaceae bacterium]|nr:hypothetical protein [Thermoguttaceae bacterium]